MEERLQKIISRAGLASRRKAEEWIREGRVTVNGRVVTEMGAKADPDRDSIKVSGRLVRGAGGAFRYILLNKPRGPVDPFRSGRAPDGCRPPEGSQGARLSGGPAGLRQRGASPAHERRRSGEQADASQARRGEDIPREGAGRACRRTDRASVAGDSPRRRADGSGAGFGRSARRKRIPGSRSLSTRGESGRSAEWSKKWGIPCSNSSGSATPS